MIDEDAKAAIEAAADQAQAAVRDAYQAFMGEKAPRGELEAFHMGYSLGMEGSLQAIASMIEAGILIPRRPEG